MSIYLSHANENELLYTFYYKCTAAEFAAKCSNSRTKYFYQFGQMRRYSFTDAVLYVLTNEALLVKSNSIFTIAPRGCCLLEEQGILYSIECKKFATIDQLILNCLENLFNLKSALKYTRMKILSINENVVWYRSHAILHITPSSVVIFDRVFKVDDAPTVLKKEIKKLETVNGSLDILNIIEAIFSSIRRFEVDF